MDDAKATKYVTRYFNNLQKPLLLAARAIYRTEDVPKGSEREHLFMALCGLLLGTQAVLDDTLADMLDEKALVLSTEDYETPEDLDHLLLYLQGFEKRFSPKAKTRHPKACGIVNDLVVQLQLMQEPRPTGGLLGDIGGSIPSEFDDDKVE